MKTKKLTRISSFLLTMVLVVTCMLMPALAISYPSLKLSFEKTDLSYQVYESKNTFWDDYEIRQPSSFPPQIVTSTSPSISDLSIHGAGETISLKFLIDGQEQTFVGALYPIVGGGYYDDKLVLGDFSSSSNYNIASFRIDKSSQSSNAQPNITLSIVLEKISDGEVYSITTKLTNDQFNMFHQVALDYYNMLGIEPNTDAYLEMMQKILSLMQINKNWFNADTYGTTSTLAQSTSFNYDSISTTNTGISVARSTLDSFFSDMDNYGRDGCRYSTTSTMGKILNQLGWKVYHNKTASAPYFYVSYGIDNGGGSHLIQIILCAYSSDYNRNTGCVESHMQVYGSVLVEWNPSYYNTENCKLLYYSCGPELTNVYLCASELAGTNTIFTKSQLSFSFYNNKNPWAGFLISRIPKYGSLIVNVWNALSVSPAEVSRWGQGYEVTVDAQVAAGGLIKDVCARSNTASLVIVGNNIHLDGTVKGTYSSHKLKFMFTAEKLL